MTQVLLVTVSVCAAGCSVEVKLHEYHEGRPDHRPYYVELWDVGGNNSYKAARHLFYNTIHGHYYHSSTTYGHQFFGSTILYVAALAKLLPRV